MASKYLKFRINQRKKCKIYVNEWLIASNTNTLEHIKISIYSRHQSAADIKKKKRKKLIII